MRRYRLTVAVLTGIVTGVGFGYRRCRQIVFGRRHFLIRGRHRLRPWERPVGIRRENLEGDSCCRDLRVIVLRADDHLVFVMLVLHKRDELGLFRCNFDDQLAEHFALRGGDTLANAFGRL